MFVSGTISGGDDATIFLVAFYIGPTTLEFAENLENITDVKRKTLVTVACA